MVPQDIFLQISPPEKRWNRPLIGLILIVFTALALLVPAAVTADPAPAAALPKPTNISCQGYERDTVVVGWTDNATDETNYRVERSIGGAAFTEVATMTPNAQGNYEAYRDLGADVSTQNRRYRIRSFRNSDSSFSPYSDVCNNRRIYEPGNFRFFYGLRNTTDDCPKINGNDVCLADVSTGGVNDYVNLQNNALQGSVDAFTRVGFDRSAAVHGSLDKIPINVVWCDGGGCAGGGGLGLSPFLMEMPFNLTTRIGDPVAWIVALHEAFHFQQFKYGGLNDPAGAWVVEGQARSIQDKFCIGANRADCEAFDDIDTGYAGYVPQVKGYLGATNQPINQTSYSAALFWTYLTEKYGTNPPSSDTVERGLNLMVRFWQDSAATPGRDGIAVLNSTLTTLGHTARFRDIWKDFAVASYAKDISGSGVPSKYRYADMAEPGGAYGPPALALSRNLNLGESAVDTDETITSWGARYYEVRPAANVPIIDIKVTQDSAVNVYYTILAIKNNDLVFEYNTESRNLAQTLINDGYSKVVVIVAGLENQANYRYSFNGTQPLLRILSPTTANKARVGSPSAPDKFLVRVETLAGDGTPLAGVNLNSFSFRVGTVDVPAANILTRATVQGQHWFVVRAPTQSSAGTYNLRASYSTILSDTQSLAVDYTPRNDADSMLIIDRSGSMGDFNKLPAAQAAARLYVDSWRTGDKLGVVSFNENVTLNMALTNWTDTPAGGSRQTAFNAINALVASGNTAIGDALQRGWDELTANGNNTHDWALVLLSDGLETAGTKTFDTLITDLTNALGKRPAVHAIAVGPDADRLRMQRIANQTGGTYYAVSVPATALAGVGIAAADNLTLNMDSRYRAIATEVIGQQQFFSLFGPLNDGEPAGDTVTIPVEGSAAEMVLSLSWDSRTGLFGNARLFDPNNNFVSIFQGNVRHLVWRVPNPTPGNWRLEIITQIPGIQSEDDVTPQQANEFLPDYLLQASLRSDVTMDVFLPTPVEDRIPGVPMPIIASLTDTGPIAGATVTAAVETPGGNTINLTLLDDGTHGDGAANDGVYGRTFYQTGTPGSYNVTVNATGTSPISGNFTRQKLLSFHIVSGGEEQNPTRVNDRDRDGLPDEWEEQTGTDPDTPDANGDPDNDGSSNREEWQRGTDPLDPDTDDGGEADGTDPDPFDPDDDRIESTRVVAYPHIGRIFVRYVLRPEYRFVGLFRGDNPDGPFTFVSQNSPGTGIFTDTNVVTGTRYCYIALALGAQSQLSARSDPSCATPKDDPLPPHGGILINGGAASTDTADVTLTLLASDTTEPEGDDPEDPIPPVPADSASGVTEMMLSHHADMRDGAWEPYTTTKTWTMSPTLGLAAVFVKYRDAAQNESEVYPATINITAPLPGTPIQNVTISGVTQGVVNTPYTFVATVSPLSATLPISYVWQVAGQPLMTHPGQMSTSDAITVTWNVTGTQTIVVTATNGISSASDTRTITLGETGGGDIRIEQVTISGPTEGLVNTPYTFVATVSPLNATLPISYVWQVAGQSPVEHLGRASASDTISLTWNVTGTQTIVVTATNGVNAAIDTHTILVRETSAAISITLDVEQASIPADGTSTATITATVRDASNVPVVGATVSFVTNLGTINPASTTTNANGIATAVLQAGTTPGTATVFVTAGGVQRSVTIVLLPRRPGGSTEIYLPFVQR